MLKPSRLTLVGPQSSFAVSAPNNADAILSKAAELAEEEYRLNPELTTFEAFGEGDLYGESSDSTESR